MRSAMALVALAGAPVLASCGGGGGGSASATPVPHAARNTLAQGSEHLAVSGSVIVNKTKFALTGSGDFQTDPRLGKVTFVVMGAGLNSRIAEVVQGRTVYMNSPLLRASLPAGKTWVALDLRKAGKRAGIDFSQFRQTSPTDTLLGLEHATDVTKLGTATIAGARTTHYRAVVDFSKVPNGAEIEKLAKIKALPVEVWIDGKNLVRRMQMTYSASVSGQSATTTVRMDLSDFGKQVHVKLPPASETIDMTSLGG